MDESTAMAIIAALGGLLILLIIVGIIAYIFMSLGLYTMAKNRGLDNAWLAWIPIASGYIEGKLIYDKIAVGSYRIGYASILLIVSSFVASFGATLTSNENGFLAFLGLLISIIVAVYSIMVMYRLYKLYKPESAVLFTVLSIIFPGLLYAILVFVIRNNQPLEYLEEGTPAGAK